MKKLITILTTIVAISMLSSCIIVAPEDEPKLIIQSKAKEDQSSNDNQSTPVVVTPSTATYSIICKNGTSLTVTDWCVKKDNIVTLANTDFNRSIRPNGEDRITGLETGYYKIFFSFEDAYQLQPWDYQSSDSVLLNQDVTYRLYERQTYGIECRSAGGSATPQLYLAGSDGSEIDLISK